MLLITCPVCGQQADETEFQPGGEAHLVRPATKNPEKLSPQALHDYLYIRKNPRGTIRELWLCARGCGKWFNARRDTVTQEFAEFYPIQAPAPTSAKPAAPAQKTKPVKQAKPEKPAKTVKPGKPPSGKKS